MVALNPSDAEEASAFIKKCCAGPSSLTRYYVREAEVSKGIFGMEVSGDSNPRWLKWERRNQQLGKDFWDTCCPLAPSGPRALGNGRGS